MRRCGCSQNAGCPCFQLKRRCSTIFESTKQTDEKRGRPTHPIAGIFERLPIPEEIFRLSKDTFSYGIGKGAEGLAALILVPILTRALSPAEFGVWDVAMTFLVLTTTVASFGLEPAVAASYFESHRFEQRKIIASTAVQFRLVSSLVIAMAVFLCAPSISRLIFRTAQYGVYLRIVAAIIPFFLFVSIAKQLLRIDFSPGKFNLVAVGNAAFYTGAAVFLVMKMRMGVNGVLLGALGAGVCFSLIGVFLTRRFLSFTFSGNELKAMLAFGLPLLPSLLAYWVIDFSDRYFLTQMSTLEQVGIYSVGAKVSSIVILFITPFQMAWIPLALSFQHEPKAKEKYSNGLSFFLFVAFGLASFIAVFGRQILMLLAQPKYYEAQRIIAPLALATVAFGAFLIINIGLILTKKLFFTSLASGAAAVLNLFLNFLLIPKFQIMGAALATLISYSSAAAILYAFAQREYRIPYNLSKIGKLAAWSILAMALGGIIHFRSSMLVDILFRIVLAGGLLAVLLWTFLGRQGHTDEAE